MSGWFRGDNKSNDIILDIIMVEMLESTDI